MTWLALHLSLGVALSFIWLHRALGAGPLRRLRLSRAVFACALLAPLLIAALPSRTWTAAPAQVWSAYSTRVEPRAAVLQLGSRRSPVLHRGPVDPGTALAIGLFALVALSLSRGALLLRRRLSGAVVVRSIGRVRIAVCPEGGTPWTAALGRSAWIVLDCATARDPGLRRLALLHEVQHLRAGDAQWAWALAALQPAFLWSPIARWLRSLMVECEELACDAAVVGRGRVAARSYAAALLDVAERGLGVAPSALPALHGHSLLRRRIDMLISLPRPVRPALDAVMIGCCFALACAGARATEGMLADHRVDEQRAQAAAQRASASGAEFPVVVNDVVLAQLNRLVATPDGRKFVQAALRRRPDVVDDIHVALSAQNLPAQLDAVPLIETGYQNIDAHEHGAGLWQFIVPTARKYGLRVAPGADDRMNPQLEAAAAARYLGELRQQFGEWPLALAAYTQGENKVSGVVQREGTRDAWELIRRGKLDPYAAKVMAAVLIIADPSLAQE